MARPLHSDELKTRAVALVLEHGYQQALSILADEGIDVKAPTLRSWMSRAGLATVTAERTAAATKAHQARWEQRRAEMAHECGAVAAKALRLMDAALDDGRMRDAQALVAPFGVMVDKAQLLSGAATTRTEYHAAPETVHAVTDEVAARRAKHAA